MNHFFKNFGFSHLADFVGSLVNAKIFLFNLKISVVLSTVVTFIELYIGLPIVVYIGFIMLFIGKFITGVLASLKEGEEFKAAKIGRIILKIFIYTTILGVLDGFSKGLGDVSAIMYSGIYWVVFNLVALQVLRSILRNLHRIGNHSEAGMIITVLDSKIIKYFGKISEPSQEITKDKNKE